MHTTLCFSVLAACAWCLLKLPAMSGFLFYKRKGNSSEVNDLQSDGRNALNNPLSSASFDMQLDENEEKVILNPIAKSDPKLQQLQHVLIDWINDVLVDERIIVKSLEDDLYDGQVLQKLLEKLGNHKLNVAEVTQSTVSQRQKLQTVLNSVDQLLKYRQEKIKWNVDLIHSKCLWGILHLLVALVNHFDAPIQLPQDVSVALLVLKKTPAGMTSEQKQEIIVGSNLPSANSQEKDKFDIIFDHEPHKLQVVTQTLMDFVNQQLIKLNLEVTDVHSQFADGVYLVLLMGLLGNFFVPLHHFHLTPDCFEQKVHNISFAFELMEDAGMKNPKSRPEDIVKLDMKATLRVLLTIFNAYGISSQPSGARGVQAAI